MCQAAASGSEHPDLAVAIGEVVGHLHETVGGEPDLALVLVDDARAGDLANAARSVHALLRPHQLVATRGPMIAAGGRVLGPRALAVVAIRHEALGRLDVSHRAPSDAGSTPASTIIAGSAADEPATGPRLVLSSPAGTASPPIVMDAAGTPCSTGSTGSISVSWPATIATVAQGSGWVDVSPPGIATSSDETRLAALDGLPLESLLVDRLQLEEPTAERWSERLPLLRVCRFDQTGSTFMSVESVDGTGEGIRLNGRVDDGDLLLLQRHDPAAAVAEVVRGVRRAVQGPPLAVLVSSTLEAAVLDALATRVYGAASGSAIVGLLDPLDAASPGATSPGATSPKATNTEATSPKANMAEPGSVEPWPRVDALIIQRGS